MDKQVDNMIKVIQEAFPDYDIHGSNIIGDLESMYYEALTKITSEKDKALRYNDGKLQWSLVHFQSLEPMVRVLEYGAKKYSRDNWKKGLDKSAILESTMRHLTALLDGEEKDFESGELHIGHIMCNAMFWQYFHMQEMNKEIAKIIRTMPMR